MKTTFSSAIAVIVHRISFHHFCKQLILPFLFFYPFAFEQALEKIRGCPPPIPVCKDLTIPFVDNKHPVNEKQLKKGVEKFMKYCEHDQAWVQNIF